MLITRNFIENYGWRPTEFWNWKNCKSNDYDGVSLEEQDTTKLEKYKNQIKEDCGLDDEEAMKLVYEALLYRKLKNSDSGDILEKGSDFGAGFS